MTPDLLVQMGARLQHAVLKMDCIVGEASEASQINWTTFREWVSLPQVILLETFLLNADPSYQIWISPVTFQLQGNTVDGEAYHGYWQQDLYQINSNFGTPGDLESLASALHDRNMVCISDLTTLLAISC